MTLLSPPLDRNDLALSFVELVGNAVGVPEGDEEGLGRKDNLEARLLTDNVADVKKPILKSDFGTVRHKENRVQIAGRHSAPPTQNSTPEHGVGAMNKVLSPCA
jgi:hypothetical protein